MKRSLKRRSDGLAVEFGGEGDVEEPEGGGGGIVGGDGCSVSVNPSPVGLS